MENYNQVIGTNLKRMRIERKLSLDKLSQLTSISKSMLSQIEKGSANPSISTVWKIAEGLRIPFTELVTVKEKDIEIIRGIDLKPLKGQDGNIKSYPIVKYDPTRGFESYKMVLDYKTSHLSEAHPEKTIEFTTIVNGRVKITIDNEEFILDEGDTLKFRADLNHTYLNIGVGDALLFTILYYSN